MHFSWYVLKTRERYAGAMCIALPRSVRVGLRSLCPRHRPVACRAPPYCLHSPQGDCCKDFAAACKIALVHNGRNASKNKNVKRRHLSRKTPGTRKGPKGFKTRQICTSPHPLLEVSWIIRHQVCPRAKSPLPPYLEASAHQAPGQMTTWSGLAFTYQYITRPFLVSQVDSG